MDKVIEYFNGDAMAADSWKDKYCMKNNEGIAMEETPADMHRRLAKEFAKTEYSYTQKERKIGYLELANLSKFGQALAEKRLNQTQADIETEFFNYFDKFGQIVPQGSIMSNLGNFYVYGSLSNCFGIASPEDSYGGIMKTDQELVQLMKRRGGVGLCLDLLRPSLASVTNAAKTSSGIPSFAERYSNTTREVAQEGRRGALMELLHVAHPDIFKFVTMKADKTKVTGANVSVKFTDEFMYAVEYDQDFVCRFPIDTPKEQYDYDNVPYNTLWKIPNTGIYIMRIKAKELFDEFINMNWDNAEPGAAYIDRVVNYSPDGVYEFYMPKVCNPCGEQWFSFDETCRLIAVNWFGCVVNPFMPDAYISQSRVYEYFYMQQRLGDNLVDLEVEYIDRIINKIIADPQAEEIKAVELNLWKRIRQKAEEGRRTGGGFTALGDMLAALGVRYGSDESMMFIEEAMRTKMEAELDCTTDMAILRGTFVGWNADLEFEDLSYEDKETSEDVMVFKGANDFYQMLLEEFPEQAARMSKHGRRNISWSTVAPTGTVSLMCQTTSGLEPLFKAYYIRRKKIISTESNIRVDFEDAKGDKWQEYSILHPKFKEWIKAYLVDKMEIMREGLLKGYKLQGRDIDNTLLGEMIDWMDKEKIQQLFELSPWFGSEADNVSWEKRIDIQALIQKYTTNSISSTINLPADVSKETMRGIYIQAWKKDLKGVTTYRDTCRDGVLITDVKLTNCDEFGYTDAIRRPMELIADYHYITSKGTNYAVFVGKLNGYPYEIFAFEDPIKHEDVTGKIVKVGTGVYAFKSPHYNVDNLQLNSDYTDERLLTRWVSMLLRHGANPKFIVEQVEKSEVTVVSFAKAMSRVLKSYIINESIGEQCTNCGGVNTMVREEGCIKCTSCGFSKC